MTKVQEATTAMIQTPAFWAAVRKQMEKKDA